MTIPCFGIRLCVSGTAIVPFYLYLPADSLCFRGKSTSTFQMSLFFIWANTTISDLIHLLPQSGFRFTACFYFLRIYENKRRLFWLLGEQKTDEHGRSPGGLGSRILIFKHACRGLVVRAGPLWNSLWGLVVYTNSESNDDLIPRERNVEVERDM